jgi:RNA polymerase sigma-70 factor (ECF subfamily)
LNAHSQDVLARSMGDRVIENGNEPLSVQNTIRRYHDSLIHFLQQRLRVPEDAHDVAQEAYVRLLQYQSSTAVRSPSSMLFRIAINVANDLGRSDKARHLADQCPVDEVELVSEQPSAERQLSAVEDLALLRAAIAGLPPKCRQVFLLSRVRQMTYPQIAGHCGISVKMVEKHISHALAICVQKVGGDDFDPS